MSAGLAQGKIDHVLTSKLESSVFTAELKPGFHFNAKAPNLLIADEARVKPFALENRKISFKLTHQGFKNGRASLFICDDALTFCEPKHIDLNSNLKNEAGQPNVSKKSTSLNSRQSKDVKRSEKNMHLNSSGFIEDDLIAAVELAKKEKKLVLADFSARWCPGCIRLESEILGTKDFSKSTKGFVKVRLDYDRFETGELKKKFAIYGIPTLIILTTDQQEVSRVVDYQPMNVLSNFLKDAESNPLSLEELKKTADANHQTSKNAQLLLGRRLYTANRFAEAVTYLSHVKPEPIELLDARVQAAKVAIADIPLQDKSNPKSAELLGHFRTTTLSAISAEPNSTRSLNWRSALVEKLEPGNEERKKIATQGVAVADDLLSNSEKLIAATHGDAVGEFTGFERLMVASQRADLIEAGGLGDNAILNALKLVTSIGKELKIPVEKTGPSMRYLIFLVAAKQFPEAEELGRALLKKDPENPEIERRLIRILNEQKKFKEAISFGKSALPKSFGKNEVWVAQQLAKAYAGQGEKLEAKALLQAFLSRPDIDWTSMRSEQKSFNELLGTLN